MEAIWPARICQKWFIWDFLISQQTSFLTFSISLFGWTIKFSIDELGIVPSLHYDCQDRNFVRFFLFGLSGFIIFISDWPGLSFKRNAVKELSEGLCVPVLLLFEALIALSMGWWIFSLEMFKFIEETQHAVSYSFQFFAALSDKGDRQCPVVHQETLM